jgi:expansin (peptidoglycan-binding protein)
MNTFNIVKTFITQNNINTIKVGDEKWGRLINVISNIYPELDSEYYGNVLLNELYDLKVNVSIPE